MPQMPPTACAPATIPSVEWQNLFGNHIYAKLLFASCAKTWIKCYRFLHVAVTWGQGRIKWKRGPGRSPDREAPKTLTTTAQRFTCPRFNFAEAPVKNLKTDTIWQQPKLQTLWGDHLFKQKVVSQKNDLFAAVTPHDNIFSHTLSDHLHCTNRPFTCVFRNDMSTLSRRSKRTPFRNNVLNETSRLKFCDRSCTIVTTLNCSVI